MKRLTKIIVVIMIAVMALGVFSACAGEEGKVTLVVKAEGEIKSYSVNTVGKDLTTLEDLMEYLVQNDEFTYESAQGFLTSVNGISPSEQNEFWGIYTDATIGDIPYYDTAWKVIVEGIEYGSASKGIAELPLTSGATYILAISTFTF